MIPMTGDRPKPPRCEEWRRRIKIDSQLLLEQLADRVITEYSEKKN
jgi:hypothetical protein